MSEVDGWDLFRSFGLSDCRMGSPARRIWDGQECPSYRMRGLCDAIRKRRHLTEAI
jgi:hypothetical protein